MSFFKNSTKNSSTESQLIIHFGQCLGQTIYDHNIDTETWELIYKKAAGMELFTQKILDKNYKIYHYDSLIYEFDLENGHHQCYADMIDNIQKMRLTETNKHLTTSLVYNKIRSVINADFQPINRYYNIHEVCRSIFKNDIVEIIFEKENERREIKIICLTDDWSVIDLQLKSLISFNQRLITPLILS